MSDQEQSFDVTFTSQDGLRANVPPGEGDENALRIRSMASKKRKKKKDPAGPYKIPGGKKGGKKRGPSKKRGSSKKSSKRR